MYSWIWLFLQPVGRLVDRHHDLRAVPHDRRHQRGVLGADLVVVEVVQLAEAEDLGVEAHPVVELALLDVADDVVDRESGRPAGRPVGLGRLSVAVAGLEQRRRGSGCGRRTCARCRRRSRPGASSSSPCVVGLGPRRRARCGRRGRPRPRTRRRRRRRARRGRARRRRGVRTCSAIGESASSAPRHDEADVALLEHVAGLVPHAGLGPGVRGAAEAERRHQEPGGGPGVADPELDAVPAEEVRSRALGHRHGSIKPGDSYRRNHPASSLGGNPY